MEIQQLRYFLVAARYQHVTKAAEEIHIAQPALSQIIKRLESEVSRNVSLQKKRQKHNADARREDFAR